MRIRKARVVLLLAGLVVAPVAVAAVAPDGSAAVNRASAQAEAARLLGLVQLPAGTAQSASEPAGDQRILSLPTYDEATPNLVDAHAWWTTNASPDAVLAYVGGHLPAGATRYVTSLER